MSTNDKSLFNYTPNIKTLTCVAKLKQVYEKLIIHLLRN